MKLKVNHIVISMVIIIFGGILITHATETWASNKLHKATVLTEGEHAGEYNPEDIRGTYLLTEVADLYKIDLSVLLEAFAINDNTNISSLRTKDLKTMYPGIEEEIGNGSVKLFVALYKNLPITLEESYLPKQAVDILLKHRPDMTQEMKDYLNSHQIEISQENLGTYDNIAETNEAHDVETNGDSCSEGFCTDEACEENSN